MATATAGNEVRQLQQRMAELEKQLRELKALVEASREPRRHWPDVPMTDEEAEAFHRENQRVDKIIKQCREADRRKAAAEYDRLHGKTKKSSPRRKSAKAGVKARKAG
jgi:hypothetical protein